MLEKANRQVGSRWAEVETLLGQDPEFGDGLAIERRALARVRVGLSLLATLAPDETGVLGTASAAPDAGLLEFIRDPLLRNASRLIWPRWDDGFPATVFLAPEKLENVWDTAGALLPCSRRSSGRAVATQKRPPHRLRQRSLTG
jgi:hypothetical protein